MTYERLGEQAFSHTDGSEVKPASVRHIEYAEKGRHRVAVVGFDMPSARRIRMFTRELSPWILESTEQQPMSDAERAMVLDRIASAYRSGGYEVDIVPP
jgi:hypothetical protein